MPQRLCQLAPAFLKIGQVYTRYYMVQTHGVENRFWIYQNVNFVTTSPLFPYSIWCVLKGCYEGWRNIVSRDFALMERLKYVISLAVFKRLTTTSLLSPRWTLTPRWTQTLTPRCTRTLTPRWTRTIFVWYSGNFTLLLLFWFRIWGEFLYYTTWH